MEFLRFIFSSFWVWLGFFILVTTISCGIIGLARVSKRNRKVTGYSVDRRWIVEIEDASTEDVQQAIISATYETPWREWERKGDKQEVDSQ